MDGRGLFQDNIVIERLWWTVKYQFLYLREFETGQVLQAGLKKWFDFYNGISPHQSLDDYSPDMLYFKELKFAVSG